MQRPLLLAVFIFSIFLLGVRFFNSEDMYGARANRVSRFADMKNTYVVLEEPGIRFQLSDGTANVTVGDGEERATYEVHLSPKVAEIATRDGELVHYHMFAPIVVRSGKHESYYLARFDGDDRRTAFVDALPIGHDVVLLGVNLGPAGDKPDGDFLVTVHYLPASVSAHAVRTGSERKIITFRFRPHADTFRRED